MLDLLFRFCIDSMGKLPYLPLLRRNLHNTAYIMVPTSNDNNNMNTMTSLTLLMAPCPICGRSRAYCEQTLTN